MTFGERFKKLRIEKGLKQQELADDFNKIYEHTFTKSSISQYENNKKTPEIKALKKFALYFDVSIDYLLGVSNCRYVNIGRLEFNWQREILYYTKCLLMNSTIDRSIKDNFFNEITKIYFDSLK